MKTSIDIDAEGWIVGLSISAVIAFVCSLFAAWVTHVVWVIKILAGSAGVTFGQFLLGVLGTLIPPIGMIHGFIIWFS